MDWKIEKGLGDGPSRGGRRVFMIAGEKVILRALEKEDLERCYRWINDPQIVHTLKSRYPMAIEKESEWLEHAIHSDGRQRHFAVERRDDRAHIGNASLHEIDWISRVASFGMFIGEPGAWNKGFGSDTISTLCRFAFQEMNLRKLKINVFDYNERAKHLLESLGFSKEGLLREEFYRDGNYHDIVIFSSFRKKDGEGIHG